MSSTSKTKSRQSNVELLRLVVMGMIVLHHFIFHGLGVYRNLAFGEDPLMNADDTRWALITDSFLICGVNVFVLISGWFSIKFNAGSFVRLFAMCSFYAVVVYLIYLVTNDIDWEIGIFLRIIKRGFCVVSSKTWWFIQLYFLLMFLSKPINKYVEVATKKSLLYTIGTFLFINVYLGWMRGIEFVKDGYNLFNFIMLYLIGRYLRLYWNNNYSIKRDIIIYIISSFLTAVLVVSLYEKHFSTYMALCYNSPFIITAAVSLFLCFVKLNFHSNLVNYFAGSSLAIYLIQEVGYNFYDNIKAMYINEVPIFHFGLMVLLFFFLSMLVPIAIDKLRLLIFVRLEEKASNVLDERAFQKFVE